MSKTRSTRDILLQTEHADEARAFYEGVLGFPVIHDDPAMCGLDTGSFNLFIDPAPKMGPILEFEVDDLPIMRARLLGAGCAVVEEDSSTPRCYLRDPFGLIFNLRQRTTNEVESVPPGARTDV